MNSRTVNDRATSTAVAELQAVLEEIGVAARFAPPGDAADLILPGPVAVQVKSASRPSLAQLRRWGLEAPAGRALEAIVVVADWIDPGLRDELERASWGWLDRTGHLRLIAGGFHIDRAIDPLVPPEVQPSNPLRRESGLAVAIELLERRASLPRGATWDTTVRAIATASGVSVGSAHRAITELTELGMLDQAGMPRSSLFWMASREWFIQWFPVSTQPTPAVSDTVQRLLRFRLDELADEGWAEAGDGAAAAYGAPIVAEAPPRLLVPDRRALTWALRTFGEASDERSASAFVAVPPTAAAVSRRHPRTPWPLARPMVIALELASSGPRGREALDHWADRPSRVLSDD